MRYILIFLIAILAPITANAVDNIYQIKGITVTVAESDTDKARNKAMQDAEKKAFEELEKKLFTSGFITSPKAFPYSQIQPAVDSIDIDSEKITSQQYKGTYTVTFSPTEISRLLSIGQISENSITDPQKYLVIPIVVEKGNVKIWKNDWLANWQSEKHDDIIFPLGDLQDVKSLKVEDLTNKNYDGIFRMQKRYSATAIAIVKAEYLEDKNALSVELQKLKDMERTTVSYEYPGGAGISATDLFEAASSDIIYRLENNKLTDNSLVVDTNDPKTAPKPKLPEPYSPNAPGTGYIGEKKYPPSLVPISDATTTPTPAAPAATSVDPSKTDVVVIAPDLIIWNAMRSKILGTPGIKDLKIKSLIGGKANITISHDGDMASLTTPLAEKDLELTQTPGQNWQIKQK